MKNSPEIIRHLKKVSEKLDKLSAVEAKTKGYGASSRRIQILSELIKEQISNENFSYTTG